MICTVKTQTNVCEQPTRMVTSMSGATTVGELLDTEQLATYLGVTARTIRSWRAAGTGPPFIQRGPKWVRYHPADVAEWLKQHTSRTTA